MFVLDFSLLYIFCYNYNVIILYKYGLFFCALNVAVFIADEYRVLFYAFNCAVAVNWSTVPYRGELRYEAVLS